MKMVSESFSEVLGKLESLPDNVRSGAIRFFCDLETKVLFGEKYGVKIEGISLFNDENFSTLKVWNYSDEKNFVSLMMLHGHFYLKVSRKWMRYFNKSYEVGYDFFNFDPLTGAVPVLYNKTSIQRKVVW